MMKLRLLIFCFALVASSSQAQTYLGSCPIFPSNNPWNQRVDSLPVHPNSAIYISHVGGATHLHPDFGSNPGYGIPWTAVNSSQPMVPIKWVTNGYGESDPGPMPIPANAKIEAPSDSHVLVVDTSNKKLYELYQGSKDQSGSGWTATCSAIFDLGANKYRQDGWTSADAAGLPIFPGLVRKYECDAGEIKHAIRFTVQKTCRGWIFPARHHAGSTNDTTFMPMGLHLRLKASFDDSKYTGCAKVIATAMKRYGIIMADNGSNWFITGENNTSWPDNDISQLKSITGNDFEVVYTGPIRTSPNQFPDPDLSATSSGVIQAPSVVHDTVLAGTNNTFQFEIKNTGSGALTIGSYSGVASPFTILDSSAHSIPAGGSTTVSIRFAPTMPGVWATTLTLQSDDGNSPVTVIALEGIATAGELHLGSNPFEFGKVKVGQSDTMMFSMSNTGTGELNISVLSPQGTNPDFALIGITPSQLPPFKLNPGATITATVAFKPTAAGIESTSYTFAVTDYFGHQIDTSVGLTGEGVETGAVGEVSARTPEISVFPNPASSMLTISTGASDFSGEFEVIDAVGRSVLSGTLHNAVSAFDVNSLANGGYFVRVKSTSGVFCTLIQVSH